MGIYMLAYMIIWTIMIHDIYDIHDIHDHYDNMIIWSIYIYDIYKHGKIFELGR